MVDCPAVAKLRTPFQSSGAHGLYKPCVEPHLVHVQLDGTRALPWLQQCASISSISSLWEGGWIPSGLAGPQAGDVGSCSLGIKGIADLLVSKDCWPPISPPFGIASCTVAESNGMVPLPTRAEAAFLLLWASFGWVAYAHRRLDSEAEVFFASCFLGTWHFLRLNSISLPRDQNPCTVFLDLFLSCSAHSPPKKRLNSLCLLQVPQDP